MNGDSPVISPSQMEHGSTQSITKETLLRNSNALLKLNKAMPLARLGTGCQAAITTSDSLYVIDINNFLHRYVKFEDTVNGAIKHPGFSQAT